MFSLFKKQPPQPAPVATQMRELLFGDLPLGRWIGDGHTSPWDQFARVQTLLAGGDKAGAIVVLRQITHLPDVESRHTLQAWHFLRELGEQPPPDMAKEVLGVVVEVGLKEGVDVLAAYHDHNARYWNWSGAGVVWERPDARLDTTIDELLRAGSQVALRIGPWEDARPAIVSGNAARINFLTPSGLHFGEAPFSALAQDPLAAPVINAATRLMQQMTELTPTQARS